MKATHTGRLKNIGDIIEVIKKDDSFKKLSTDYIYFLHQKEGDKIELVKEYDNNYIHVDDDFWVTEEMFSKIEEIKPKKETRPFTDEEWKEWFLEDGVLMNKESKCLWKPSAMIEGIKFFEHYIDGDIDQPLWMDKEEVLEKFTDRHGNKFEKEL